VILVADAFDAMTSVRAYQPALPVEYAVDEIRRNSGTQFDPGVVEVFLDLAERDMLPRALAG
jgi:HD-GYP domain-containing protein (c-di-GMP phosphodiesterase class II)